MLPQLHPTAPPLNADRTPHEKCHPFLEQLISDLASLQEYDDIASIASSYANCPLRMFQCNEDQSDFLSFDMSIIRSIF